MSQAAVLPGVLLVNLGSPASTQVGDVRKYLNEFLMDGRVIDLPWALRRLIVSAFILPTRPAKSAEAYRAIWQPTGSPLVYLSRQLRDQLQLRTEYPVELAMRYGQPSIAHGLKQLKVRAAQEVRLIPLYPHYAMSSFETVVVKVKEEMAKLQWQVPLKVLPPFYQHPAYIEALYAASKAYLEQDFDKLLFSYHGIPEHHVQKTDPSGQHCLIANDCCRVPHAAQAYCYRHQVFETTKAFVERAGLQPKQYQISFQSRLGRRPWLKPYTDLELEAMPGQGVKKLLVICPSFVSDCLETLEEIAIRGTESFEQAGGESLTYIPCMNTHSTWVKALADWVHDDAAFVGAEKGSPAMSAASGV